MKGLLFIATCCEYSETSLCTRARIQLYHPTLIMSDRHCSENRCRLCFSRRLTHSDTDLSVFRDTLKCIRLSEVASLLRLELNMLMSALAGNI